MLVHGLAKQLTLLQNFHGRYLFWYAIRMQDWQRQRSNDSLRLAYQSIGVIYGDIGTSPLYVYSSTFSSEPSRQDLLGAVSLIIWTLTLIVTIKYVLIVLRADDEGEGGTFAVYSLLSRYVGTLSHLRHCARLNLGPGKYISPRPQRREIGEDGESPDV